jgi:hypothetical protein
MSFGTVQAEKMTTESGYSLGAGNASSFKNRIINGNMTIDQRNGGASLSITTSTLYTLDRWQALSVPNSIFTVQQNAGSVTPPAGFTNYLGVTSTASTSIGATDRTAMRQIIEGFNVADLGWGTANAKTVTLSFWVRSSLTGTFGGALINNTGARSYPFSYAISSANTWTQISVTVAGDTTGTWETGSSGGINVTFGLGVGTTYSGTAGAWAGSLLYSATGAVSVVGTSGATFYITGVQFEVGTVATSFDFRSYGTELQLCQRYFQSFSYTGGTMIATGSTFGASTGALPFNFYFPMRTTPSTITLPAVGSTNGQWTVLSPAGGFPGTFGTIVVNSAGPNSMRLDFTGYTGVFASSGQAAFLYASGSTTTVVTASAEL